jgi:hypothetical protein
VSLGAFGREVGGPAQRLLAQPKGEQPDCHPGARSTWPRLDRTPLDTAARHPYGRFSRGVWVRAYLIGHVERCYACAP